MSKSTVFWWPLVLLMSMHWGWIGTEGKLVKLGTVAKVKDGWVEGLNEKLQDLDYAQYLNSVIELLQGEQRFFEKLIEDHHEKGLEESKAAEEMTSLPNDIRSRLDELKRIELNRLIKYSNELKKRNITDNKIVTTVKKASDHLDMKNMDSFGPEDLKKLINHAVEHLQALDEVRRQKFKEYEMHKHLELEEIMERLTPMERTVVMENLEQLKKYHKRQKPMYIPLSKPHLMEVWEDMDEMNRENFNIKTFFRKHDLDGNDFLDEYEVKVLLRKEADRFYNKSAPDYDKKEVDEEIEKMREYLLKEADKNKDRLIGLGELIQHTIRKDLSDTEFWENMGNKPVYTKQEYENYAREHRAEVADLVARGKITLPGEGVLKILNLDKVALRHLKHKQEGKKRLLERTLETHGQQLFDDSEEEDVQRKKTGTGEEPQVTQTKGQDGANEETKTDGKPVVESENKGKTKNTDEQKETIKMTPVF